MKRHKNIFVLFAMLLLAGCAAMLVPETADPTEKLRWARELLDNQNRPLPAERLIRESIAIYEGQNNDLGLANAYRTYGLFFSSAAVARSKQYYDKHGFLDQSAKYEVRFQKALEYFEKSRDLLQKNQPSGALTNIYLQIGLTYQRLNQTAPACASFDKSLESNRAVMAQDPKAKIVLPKEYATYEEAMADIKKKTGCNV